MDTVLPPLPPRADHVSRRARLAAQMGADALAVIPTAPQRTRNRDSDYPYRHDSYFYYLTGFAEPQAWLVLQTDAQGGLRSTLFCQPKDAEREIWDGIRLGPQAAPAALGVDEAFAVAELDERLPRWLENKATLWWPFATHDTTPGAGHAGGPAAKLEVRIDGWLRQVRARARYGALCPAQQGDLCALLDEMRLIKDAHELALLRRAAHISAGAHVRAMQRCAAMLRAGHDLREYHLDAELLHEFRRHGSQYPAYTSIVAAGANACILHYHADAAAVRAGQLVLIDAGCELDGYASDITRTFPANGQFSGPQRALYELVLASQQAAVAATRPGARFTDPHDAVVRVLAQGLLDLGLLDKNKAGNAQDVIDNRAYFAFYMHRTGHWMGMDVHDCGSYVEPSEASQASERQDPLSGETIQNRPSRILRPGMVLTIEPGLYVRPAPGVPEQFWNLGVRIEDDAVVSADPAFNGCERITRGVPVAPDEIEALMRD